MNSILDAIQAAQQRNMMRDQMNAMPPTVMAPQAPMLPIIPQGGSGGDGPQMVDTRTPHEQYLDAVDSSKYIGMVPVVGPVLGVLNDRFIEQYEAKNPDMVVGGGPAKFSTLGRIAGKGLTVEEQLQAKKDGLGVFGALFGETNSAGVRAPSYSLFDRVFGNTPQNWAARSDYIGVAPSMTSNGWESGGGGDGPEAARGTTNFGGRESSIGMDDRSGYA